MDLFAVHYAYDDRTEDRDAIRSSHIEYLDALVRQGALFAYGRYADELEPGALFIYRADGSDAVEAWVARDPFVVAGLVPGHTVRAWPALGTWPQSLVPDA
jgi:uncharacterized protein YciI